MSADPDRTRRLARRATLVGVVLALLCSTVPEEYREICRVAAQICTGGLLP